MAGLVKEFQSDEDASTLDIGLVFRRTAVTAERCMGGTSGAIYAIFLNAAANRLTELATAEAGAEVDVKGLIQRALQGGLDELCRYTPARVGHRTLMDALIPFVAAYADGHLEDAIDAAAKGAASTKKMAAKLGRASYVGQDRFDEEGGIPDPGALGVVSILRGVLQGLIGAEAGRDSCEIS